jgi:hypothetical protein
VAHDRADSQNYGNMQQRQYKSWQPSDDKSVKTSSLDQSSDVNTKLEEIRSLCKIFFQNPLRDVIIKSIELDISSHKGKESRLDSYLQYLRQGEAIRAPIMQKGIEKPVKEKIPLSLHPDLYDFPQAAKDSGRLNRNWFPETIRIWPGRKLRG